MRFTWLARAARSTEPPRGNSNRACTMRSPRSLADGCPRPPTGGKTGMRVWPLTGGGIATAECMAIRSDSGGAHLALSRSHLARRERRRERVLRPTITILPDTCRVRRVDTRIRIGRPAASKARLVIAAARLGEFAHLDALFRRAEEVPLELGGRSLDDLRRRRRRHAALRLYHTAMNAGIFRAIIRRGGRVRDGTLHNARLATQRVTLSHHYACDHARRYRGGISAASRCTSERSLMRSMEPSDRGAGGGCRCGVIE